MRIMIIEDDKIMAGCITRALQKLSPLPGPSQGSPKHLLSSNSLKELPKLLSSLEPAKKTPELPSSPEPPKDFPQITVFTDVIQAIQQLDTVSPQLIFLDVLLNGPDGFSFLHELRSYDDTVDLPVIIITSLDLKLQDLASYGIQKVLRKETMTPEDIANAAQEALATYA